MEREKGMVDMNKLRVGDVIKYTAPGNRISHLYVISDRTSPNFPKGLTISLLDGRPYSVEWDRTFWVHDFNREGIEWLTKPEEEAQVEPMAEPSLIEVTNEEGETSEVIPNEASVTVTE